MEAALITECSTFDSEGLPRRALNSEGFRKLTGVGANGGLYVQE